MAIDLFCGLGGWTEGLLAEGYEVVGFDVERHAYGEHLYPGRLVLQDVLTLHGSQFRDADLIVASPPCQEYSYMAMPWSRARAIAAEYRSGERDVGRLTALFDACFRIQREACAAAGRHIPLVVENVRGAQAWVGRARWNFGSFYLWGDVPALMPSTVSAAKNAHLDGGSWFAIAHNTASGHGKNPDGRKVAGVKCGGDWFNDKQPSISRLTSSKSPARKQASALIAKIPLPLARHIARAWLPKRSAPPERRATNAPPPQQSADFPVTEAAPLRS